MNRKDGSRRQSSARTLGAYGRCSAFRDDRALSGRRVRWCSYWSVRKKCQYECGWCVRLRTRLARLNSVMRALSLWAPDSYRFPSSTSHCPRPNRSTRGHR
jgi:hypothetical protein